MLYCYPCKEERRYPGTFPTSYGKCEVCGQTTHCYDAPSSALPKADPAPIDNAPLGMKLSALNLMPGDKIRPVAGSTGRPIKDGKVWTFRHLASDGTYFATRPEYGPDHKGTPLSSSHGWEVVERADHPKETLSALEYEALSGEMAKPEPGAPAGGYPGSLEQMGHPAAPPQAEHIVAAAVQIEGVTISLPRPTRHGTILACISYSLNISPGHELQGFLTSTGRFVNRIQARHIADIAGQQPGRSGGRDNPELYSEDLW